MKLPAICNCRHFATVCNWEQMLWDGCRQFHFFSATPKIATCQGCNSIELQRKNALHGIVWNCLRLSAPYCQRLQSVCNFITRWEIFQVLIRIQHYVLNTIVVANIIIFLFLAMPLAHQNSKSIRHTKLKLCMMIGHINVSGQITFWTKLPLYFLRHYHIWKILWTAISQKVFDIQHFPWNMIYLGS